MPKPAPTIGDRVRIRSTPETELLGVANRVGIVFGQSIPSASGVGPVVGDKGFDYALNVDLGDDNEGLWYSEDLVDFADYPAGTELQAGDERYIRTAAGEWALLASAQVHTSESHSVEGPAERSPADFLGRMLDRIWPD